MATTKQVRALLRRHIGPNPSEIWTEKRKGPTGQERKVKVYRPYSYNTSEQEFLNELNQLVGQDNWYYTPGGECDRHSTRHGDPGLIIRCMLG